MPSDGGFRNLCPLMQTAGTESTWFYELLAWVQEHSKQVIAGSIAVLAAIFLGYTYNWHLEQQELAASSALLKAAQPADNELPAPAELARVADDYGSTTAAERAVLLEASAYYQAGQYSEARQAFERFAREQPGSLLAPIAALGAAACLDAQQQETEAVTAYQQVIARYPEEAVAGRARLNLAAIYLAQDNPAEALKLYDQLTEGAGFSTTAMQAMSRREELLQAHPELAPAPTNAPAAVITPAPVTPPDASPAAGIPEPAPATEGAGQEPAEAPADKTEDNAP